MGFCEMVPTITGSSSGTQWVTLNSVIPERTSPKRLRMEATVAPCHALPHDACAPTVYRSRSSGPWAHLGRAKGCGWAPDGSSAPIFSIQTTQKPPKSSNILCDVHTRLVRVTAFPSRPVRVQTASHRPRAPPPAAEAPLYATVCWLAAQERKTSELVLNQFNAFQWHI